MSGGRFSQTLPKKKLPSISPGYTKLVKEYYNDINHEDSPYEAHPNKLMFRTDEISDNTALFVHKISTLEKFLHLVDCQHLSHMSCEQIPCTFYKLCSVLVVYHSFLPHSAMTPSSSTDIC